MTLFSAVRSAVFQHRAKNQGIYTRTQKGFTLFEILIVLGILGGLIALLVGNLGGMSSSARKKQTMLKATTLHSALIRYQSDMGSFPTTEQGLGVLINNTTGSPKWTGPYAGEDDVRTPGGEAIAYTLTPKGPQLTAPDQDGPEMVFLNGKLVEEPQESGAQ